MFNKQVPYFKGGKASLIDEQTFLQIQQEEALQEALVADQVTLEQSLNQPEGVPSFSPLRANVGPVEGVTEGY